LRVSIIVGTRPEIVKMSPIIRACQAQGVDYRVTDTGQHYDYNMNGIFFETLELPSAHHQLQIGSGSHGQQTGRLLAEIERVLLDERPDVVLVEGDTNTVLAGGLAASKLRIKVGHVEAGLRSHDRNMPEETNRILTDHLADYLFAPTAEARGNLLREGISAAKIYVTGNTIVDAVQQSLEIARKKVNTLNGLGLSPEGYFLITVHRAENVDCRERLRHILQSFQAIHDRLAVPLLFPVHPRTQKMLETFDLTMPACVRCIEPVGFLDFLQLEAHAGLILTDSGGVQEEACILHVPCVTLRDNTERPETVMVGGNVIAGVLPEKVTECVETMLDRPRTWANPLGDGQSGRRIVEIIQRTK
jgi:UDP-N-acetylglucosamine 2-epimerase (non-hydrolysing)